MQSKSTKERRKWVEERVHELQDTDVVQDNAPLTIFLISVGSKLVSARPL